VSALEVISVPLDQEELARIDALAKSHGFTREEMIVKLMRIGLPMVEAPDRDNEGES
jgi:metal-responsive CopG/Arc/MetJ family transcriptional regulator